MYFKSMMTFKSMPRTYTILTDDQVAAILASPADDVSVAATFKISRSHVKNIRAGRRRKLSQT